MDSEGKALSFSRPKHGLWRRCSLMATSRLSRMVRGAAPALPGGRGEGLPEPTASAEEEEEPPTPSLPMRLRRHGIRTTQ